MKNLNRMLFREIKKSSGQFIAIIILVAIGVMMYTGINSTFLNLENTRDKYYEGYNFEHIEVSGYTIPDSAIDKIRNLQNVKMATGRIILNGRLKLGSDYPESRVISYRCNVNDIVNNINITEGSPLGSGSMNECIVEKTFIDGNELKIGDVISPAINGKNVNLKIAGICKSPEYVYVLNKAQDLLPDPKKFGIIYISKNLSDSLFASNGNVNNIAILLDSESPIKNVKAEIENILKPYDGIRITERKDQLSNFMLKEELDGLKSMGVEVPVVFFIVASVIIYLMLGRIIENKRIYIGILKSLGYRNKQILTHYMAYPVIISAAGSIIGSIAGYFLGMIFTNLENQYFGFPVLHYSFYLNLIFPAVSLTFLFCLISAFAACKSVLKISPSESMKPPAPKMGKQVILEKIPYLWKGLRFTEKMKLRSIARNRKRNVLTAVGVILSTAVLVIGFSIGNSLNYMIKQIYDVEQKYDIKVNFSIPSGTNEIEKIKAINNIASVEPLFEGAAEVKNGKNKKDVTFTASKSNSSLYKALDENGKVQKLPDAGILVPKRLIDSLDINTGDYIDIKPYYPNSKTTRIKISGICSQYLGLGVDMNINNLSSILGKDQIYTGALIELVSANTDDISAAKSSLYNLSAVDTVEFRDDAKKNMESSMELFSLFSIFIIVLAAVMSIAVIYNITVINIYEKKRELASLKVMGFTKKEIRSSVYSENIIVGIISIIIGLPLGRFLARYIMGYFYTTDAYSFPVVTFTPSYIYTVLLIIIFILSAQLLLRKRIDNIDMVEVLKVRE